MEDFIEVEEKKGLRGSLYRKMKESREKKAESKARDKEIYAREYEKRYERERVGAIHEKARKEAREKAAGGTGFFAGFQRSAAGVQKGAQVFGFQMTGKSPEMVAREKREREAAKKDMWDFGVRKRKKPKKKGYGKPKRIVYF